MRLRPSILAFLLLTLPLLSTSSEFFAPNTPPNIVLIMVDDMGWSDIGPYGGEIPTPNLDRLAKNGLRFKQFYNTGRCCPTRASLLTGLYPHQTGVGHMAEDPESPDQHQWGTYGYQGFLNRNCVTLAEVLKTQDYHTYMVGKWHVGMHGAEKGLCNEASIGITAIWLVLAATSNHKGGVAFGPITKNWIHQTTPIIIPPMHLRIRPCGFYRSKRTTSPFSSTWPTMPPIGLYTPSLLILPNLRTVTTKAGMLSAINV